jgi:hypothetical protein
MRSLCIALIVLLMMECLEEVIVVLLQCQPLEKAWDITDSIPGHCLNMTVFYYVSFGIKLATDIAIFVLPIPPLLRLRVRGLQKFGVLLMFSLGLLYGHLLNYLNAVTDQTTQRLRDQHRPRALHQEFQSRLYM